MYINGNWIENTALSHFAVTNPANGEVIGEALECQEAEVEQAIQAAQQAFKTWSKTTAYQRSKCLYRAYELMLEQKDALAELMTLEQGKPLKAALNEVIYGADFLLWYAEEAKRVYGETIPSARSDQRFWVNHKPVGVVAAITPWNYPISMIARKIAPAVAAGCTVVLKPAESTPLCAIAMFKIFEQAGFPAGVVNLVTASNPAPIGTIFCAHPAVRKLTFTGSTAVGKHLATLAAPHLKRVSMELGGHAPAIVFEDADPVHAAKGLSLVKFLNTGQACISPNRIFVHRSIADPFLAEFSKRVDAMPVGDGMNPSVRIGPLINQAAIDKVDTQVKDAISKGATLLNGGEAVILEGCEKGHFYRPTLLSNVTPEMKIYREETFGPVAAVIIFDTEDEVLEMANDTHYGLAAYLYTNNLSRAMRVFEALEFGIIGINDINPTSAAAPFGGMQESGLGREGAKEGIFEYLETKLGGVAI
ncbi:succinate semialdehyde dehydrogenase [Oceanospirillum multiglobuliferum]|uniref:Succinate-semialdehyde dehydrogenase (NADP(+)) n=1 Tax=Oceanospirillum multiglobuliferum TaxID=64969 RepID=A0A1T4KF95_9GAMM|nr:NAD-dependent succinate-semialdehyde dehydrogenase [Oceanospirillum multiglobuliferum]OPX56013.1 succinate-semialdehyde dehydrogenase (NADP(+)) [Oceanospirillum multiglobuliferum]SJZ41128.1 succinate semialdehyde dehydrogenase [Oceanospirillum multiglobuliferum]